MKIATVTLNPAIDQTVRVDNFRTNTVNRGQSMQLQAGGKGVNVASFLTDAGYSAAATGFLGRENVEIFERFFALQQIKDAFVRIPGNTRTGVKIVDQANLQTTDINLPGETPPASAVDTLLQRIEELSASCDWFALAGSLPPGLPATIYATIIDLLKARGKSVALDTSHEALHKGILAGPTLVKPNIDELQQLVGHPLADEVAIEQAARQVLDYGSQLVVISMGEKGAMFVNRESTFIAMPPSVPVKSTVGAGDAMVTGLIVGHIQGLGLPDCARLATAFSMGAITRTDFHLPAAETLQAYAQQVTIRTYQHSS
jgi:1-phosphofructokinase